MEKAALFNLLREIIPCAQEAGAAIMDVYHQEDIGIVYKNDDSPVTKADMMANAIIEKGLKLITPSIPIISEESEVMPFHERKNHQYVWIVDPLDGTREFINRNGEFCVNIALVEDGHSVLGVLLMPALKEMAYASKGNGAFHEKNGHTSKLDNTQFPINKEKLRIACSRSYINKETKEYIATHYANAEQIASGSATKFMLLCNGKADIYPRLGTTMEWDIAAPQIILEEAGGCVVDLQSKTKLVYNKEDLKNPEFLAYSNASYCQ